MKRVVCATVLICLFVSSAFAAKQWEFYDTNSPRLPPHLYNRDPQGLIRHLWLWKTSEEGALWGVGITFNTTEEHDRFATNMRKNMSDVTVTQRNDGPLDLLLDFDPLGEELPVNSERWIRILEAIHAVEPLTPGAIEVFENLLGFRLPREAFSEIKVPGDTLQNHKIVKQNVDNRHAMS